MSDPMTMTNDEAHDFLASRMSPEDAGKLGAAIRAIRAKAIKDAEEWGLSGVPEGAASEAQGRPSWVHSAANDPAGLYDDQWEPVSPVPSPEPLDVIAAKVTALAHLSPEDWAKRRGADPIARTINAVLDILDEPTP